MRSLALADIRAKSAREAMAAERAAAAEEIRSVSSRLRAEGKEYEVQDSDVLLFLFN